MINRPIHILLVEDNPADALLLQVMLEERSSFPARWTHVQRLSQAIEQLAHDQPDAVVLDLSLPDGHGIETLTSVRPHAIRIPIIVITGTNDETLALNAMHAGAQDYLVKGHIDGELLQRTLRYSIERKQAEEQLRYQAHLLANVNDAIIGTDMDFNVTTWNAAAEKMYGWSANEILGHPVHDFLQTKYEQEERGRVLQQFMENGVWRGEAIQRRKDGSWLTVFASVAQVRDVNDTPIASVSINRDISQPKQAEEALRESEERFRRAIQDAPYPIQIHADDGEVITVNQAWLQQTGYKLDEISTIKSWTDLAYRERAAEIREQIKGLHEIKGRVDEGEETVRIASGETRLWQFSSAPLGRLPDGRHLVISMAVDITERKQAEEQIQNQFDRLTSLHKIELAISSSFDVRLTLGIVLQQVISILKVDAAAILLARPHTQALEFGESVGFRSNVIESVQLKLGEGYAGRAVIEHRTIHIANFQDTHGDLAEALRRSGEDFVDYYGTPLVVKGEVKGVLEIYHRTRLKSDKDWLDFLEVLARQAAIAIDSSQLFEDLQRVNMELEQRVAKRTAELNQSNIELEHANRAKDEFLATMSHELRTPLNSILGLSESLMEQRRDPLTAQQFKSLQIISESGRHLLELINDVLDLSKIEAGKFDYFPQVVAVDDLCRSSLMFIREAAVRKSINLVYEPEMVISKVYADPRRLKQILVNLLANAVKFTSVNGKVTLQVQADVTQGRIRFSVIDTGIGIAVEDLRKLFVPFAQLDSSLTREYEGTGLGLALVQKLTDLHGGGVDVESEVGRGSRFTINLPIGAAPADQPEVKRSGGAGMLDKADSVSNELAEPTSEHRLVLLAEDNMANILTIGDYLESCEYQVIMASDGLEAIEKAATHNPDIILMDIQMPALDGLEATRRLRADIRFASTPIIALTALAMPGDRERCLQAGANEYLSKPVSLKNLVLIMDELIAKRAS